MRRSDEYDLRVADVEALLRERPLTSSQIAMRTGCTRQTADARLRSLEERLLSAGEQLCRRVVDRSGRGVTGPRFATAYSVGERSFARRWLPG